MIFRALAVLLLTISTALASPLTLVTTSGPGSLSDTAARYFAPLLERELGRPVVVQNAPGAMGLVGMRAYQQMPHDGNALLIGGTQVPYVAKVMAPSDFDPMVAFEPLHGLSYARQQILVPSASPVKTAADLAKLQRKKGALNGGSSHPSTQTSMELLDAITGAKTTVVNYKQSAQLATELAVGIIDYTIGAKGNSATAGFVANGMLRVVADLRDLGVEEFSWTGFFIHADAPDAAKRRLIAAIDKVMYSPEAARFHQERYLLSASGLRRQMQREFDLIPAP